MTGETTIATARAGWEEDYIPTHRDETAMDGAPRAALVRTGKDRSRSLRDDKQEGQEQRQQQKQIQGFFPFGFAQGQNDDGGRGVMLS
jgi:hypothetical protein